MPRKSYIIAIGKPEKDSFFSFGLTHTKLAIAIFILIGSLTTISYLLSQSVHRLYTNYKLIHVKNENNLLKQSIASMEVKIDNLSSTLNNLQERNNQIRITAGLSLPDITYGVGGPESSMMTNRINPPELQNVKLNLENLENRINMLLYSTRDLEETISSKILEISHFPSIRPVKGGWYSSGFGQRIDPFTGETEDHPGLDISIKPESEVFASAAGTVKAVNTKVIKNKGYGKYILIDHGYGYETLYAHLSKIYVNEGQKVKRGDLIGLTGNTGKSTAPHLHYGVFVNGEPKNPFNFILN
ncbi:M23 family metallopeptidase [bacterium]|nr:M23 family metallopeptidase [bacterium]